MKLAAVLGVLILWRFIGLGNDREALLAAITAHPDEDTPRLAYADWLDEHGTSDADRAHAEFIRLQIKAYRATDRHSAEFLSEQRQAEALLQKYSKEWTPKGLDLHPMWTNEINFPVRRGSATNHALWRRGFIERVSFGSNFKVSQLATLESLPALDSIVLFPGTHFQELDADRLIRYASKALMQVRAFQLDSLSTDGRAFVKLLPHLNRVEHLHVDPATIHDGLFLEVLDSAAARRLKTLSLGSAMGHLPTVMGNTTMKHLETLIVGDFTANDLSTWSGGALPALKHLAVRRASQAMVSDLVAHPRFKTLSSLSVTPPFGVGISDDVLNAMAATGTSLTYAEVLDTHGNHRPLPTALSNHLQANRANLACSTLAEKMGGS